jgi:ABC-type multidrug transport system permease subunit
MALRLFGAPLLALMQLATFEATIFAVQRDDGGNAQQSLTLLYLSAAICLFLSAFTSANVITREAGIYRRERLVGLSPAAYVAAKVAVLSVFSIVQGILFIAVLALKIDFPGAASNTLPQLAGALVLVSLAGMGMGLFISSVSPNADRAAILVVLALIPQLIFAGSTVPRSEMSHLSKGISELTVTKWSIELTGIATGLDERFDTQATLQVPVPNGPPKVVEVPHQPFQNAFTGDAAIRWIVLAGFVVVFVSGTFISQSRKGRPG